MRKIWVVGSLNVDLVARCPRFPKAGESLYGTSFGTYLGGKGGNQAAAAGKLGGNVKMVGCVGDDQFGARYVAALTEAGVNAQAVRTVAGFTTGTAMIEVEESGQNRIVVVPGANSAMEREQVLRDADGIAEGDVVLLQLEIPLETVWAVVDRAAGRGATVILDPAPAASVSEEVLPKLSWITPNEGEAEFLTGIDTNTEHGLIAAASALLKAGAPGVLVKAGPRGAFIATAEKPTPRLIPGHSVEVVDTTAAGDSFNGGLAWALSQDQSMEHAVRTANAVAALSVTGAGAQTAMPSRNELEAFLANR